MNTKEKEKTTEANELQGRQRSPEARANEPKGDEEKGEPHATTHGPIKQMRDRQEKVLNGSVTTGRKADEEEKERNEIGEANI